MSKIGNSICGGAAPEQEVGTSYFDQDEILSKWGFDGNHCFYCGIKNSELSGLLMQCGKCKKAYYCGMKCFNADLPEHSKWCGTKQIASQPSKGGTNPDPGLRNIVKEKTEVKFFVDQMPEEEVKPKKKAYKEEKKKKKEKKTKEVDKKPEEEPAIPEPILVEEPPTAVVKPVVVEEPPADEPEEVPPSTEEEVVELNTDDENSERDDEDEDARRKFGSSDLRHDHTDRSYSSEEHIKLRPTERNSPQKAKSLELEVVDLRETEVQRREIEKYTPEWIARSPLRRTKHGEVIKTAGDVRSGGVSPSIDISKKEISFQKPEWVTKRSLKKTELGDKIKQGIDPRSPQTKSNPPADNGTGGLDTIPILG